MILSNIRVINKRMLEKEFGQPLDRSHKLLEILPIVKQKGGGN
jgi:hypothetical protein